MPASSQIPLSLIRLHRPNCLSNAMHGQNINLPVCVCLCVCVPSLSVNSSTGQTPQRIFTVDSLKYADLRKDVPFGVSMMNN